jgi:lipoprotein-releasing system ATP-binding protein
MSFIQLQQVHKSFGQTHVLRGIDISIEEKEVVAIRGASGSGKSTLFYLLGGLDRPTKGQVLVNGKNLSKMNEEELASYRNSYVGFVFQFHFLLPSMSCEENILLPARIGQRDLSKVTEQMKKLAEFLGVTHCLSKAPYEISGGEQQRINIIRALSLRPKLLLCDEPTGNLDSKNSNKVVQLLKDLASEFGATLMTRKSRLNFNAK